MTTAPGPRRGPSTDDPSRRVAPVAFTPYIPADRQLPELTPLPLIVGTLLGMIFGASSLYLVLKVGLTVSASIPVAVISITLFKLFHRLGGRDATILQNNITQTAGSAGESIAFGVGVTMPAILILGFDLELARVALVAVLGGLLGILMMIPLRRALIVQQHGLLKYPEGTACAVVLQAAASEESRAAASDQAKAELEKLGGSTTSAKTIFTGFGIGLVYQALMVALKGWRDVPEKVFAAPFRHGSISAEISPALLGVGYIIGPRIASIMCGGGVLAFLVLIPLIAFFGEGIERVIPPGDIPLGEMDHNDIRNAYVLYIAAGAVAAGGIISVARSLPMIWRGLRGGLQDLRATRNAQGPSVPRTDQDLPMRIVIIGILLLVVAISLAWPLYTSSAGPLPRVGAAVLVVIFGFLFVTVSSRLTGEIGSTSNPISGMTVATLLLTCVCFLLIGWTGPTYYVTALSIGAVVCIAASNGGTTSQDLKTGFLVGSTPRLQQLAILFGALASALILGPILLRLNDAATVYVPLQGSALQAPAAELLPPEGLSGPQARSDSKQYAVWFHSVGGGHPQKYLVGETGVPVYLVDPGINGTVTERPDGTTVRKFDAPKAALMSYIIKGMLDRKLPWGLVLLGIAISVVLEMASIPSLAFAVGVYLPLSSSTPILIGGLVRWGVDRHLRRSLASKELTEEQIQAETDKSPGVLMSSGYIAGGAIAGIVIAFMAGILSDTDAALTDWSRANNPFFSGPLADLLSLLPFALITVLLYLTGRGLILRHQPER